MWVLKSHDLLIAVLFTTWPYFVPFETMCSDLVGIQSFISFLSSENVSGKILYSYFDKVIVGNRCVFILTVPPQKTLRLCSPSQNISCMWVHPKLCTLDILFSTICILIVFIKIVHQQGECCSQTISVLKALRNI